MMIVDLHNHTPLCKHAVNSPLEYAKRAFEIGCKIYGFSDHAPMNFDLGYRMAFSQMEIYEDEILALKSEFDGKMEILLGYEVDWLEGFVDERVLARRVDYFIGSVHFLNSWGFDNPDFIKNWYDKDIDEVYEAYFNSIKALAQSGKFDILGHFDLIKVFGFYPKKDIRILAKEALRAIKEANLVVELNASGYKKACNEAYPGDNLLEEIACLDIPITLGSDAHSVEHVGLNGNLIEKKAREFGYNRVAVFKNRDRIFIDI